jgi:hypothetical protein
MNPDSTMDVQASKPSTERSSRLPQVNSNVPGSYDDVDAVLANELNRLSVHERNSIFEEIHGVHSLAPEETPERIQAALQQLEQALYPLIQERHRISVMQQNGQEQQFYEAFAAVITKSPFLTSTEVRLRYLRADLLDPKKAAVRMVDHFRLLFKYFGEYVLNRPLRFKDLKELDQEVLRQGVYQVLPSRDRASRLILYHHGAYRGKRVTNVQRLRVQLYFHHVLSEDAETQKNGLVFLFSSDGRVLQELSEPEFQKDWKDCVCCHPLRFSGLHVCLPPGPATHLLKAFLMISFATSEQRVRVKFYSDLVSLETQYQLMSYGIPIQELPMSCTGTVKTKNLNQWIQSRIAIDEAREKGYDTSSLITHPGTCDVLFSKGGNSKHQGNLEFHSAMESYIHNYNATSNRREKRQVREQIIMATRSKGGRFLELSPTGAYWTEIHIMDVVHNKVTSALNDCTRTMKARENRQRSQSDTLRFLDDGNKRRKLQDNHCCK